MSFDRFLLAVESLNLSQADKSIVRVPSFSILQNFNFWMIKFTVIPKKNYLALDNLILSFKNWSFLKFLSFLSFSGERQIWEDWKNSFCWKFRPQFLRDRKRSSATPHYFGKEYTLIILLSAWDRSRDSTAKRNLSKDM